MIKLKFKQYGIKANLLMGMILIDGGKINAELGCLKSVMETEILNGVG